MTQRACRVESKTGLEFDTYFVFENRFSRPGNYESGKAFTTALASVASLALITASLFRHLVAFQRNRTLSVHNTAVD